MPKTPDLGLNDWYPRESYCEGDDRVCDRPRTLARWAEQGHIRTLYIRGKAHHHKDDVRAKVLSTMRGRNPQRVLA